MESILINAIFCLSSFIFLRFLWIIYPVTASFCLNDKFELYKGLNIERLIMQITFLTLSVYNARIVFFENYDFNFLGYSFLIQLGLMLLVEFKSPKSIIPIFNRIDFSVDYFSKNEKSESFLEDFVSLKGIEFNVNEPISEYHFITKRECGDIFKNFNQEQFQVVISEYFPKDLMSINSFSNLYLFCNGIPVSEGSIIVKFKTGKSSDKYKSQLVRFLAQLFSVVKYLNWDTDDKKITNVNILRFFNRHIVIYNYDGTKSEFKSIDFKRHFDDMKNLDL